MLVPQLVATAQQIPGALRFHLQSPIAFAKEVIQVQTEDHAVRVQHQPIKTTWAPRHALHVQQIVMPTIRLVTRSQTANVKLGSQEQMAAPVQLATQADTKTLLDLHCAPTAQMQNTIHLQVQWCRQHVRCVQTLCRTTDLRVSSALGGITRLILIMKLVQEALPRETRAQEMKAAQSVRPVNSKAW
jgi:hypothetical protein